MATLSILPNQKNDKVEFKKNIKFSEKEVVPVSIGESVWIMKKPKLEDKKSTSSFKDATKKHPTIKEL